jgi:hypothetical protein
LRRLDFLDLSRNALTAKGVRLLEATGVKLDASYQHGGAASESGYDYLDAGDCE